MIVKRKFQSYKLCVAKLSVTKLSGYQIVRLPNCQVTKLSGYQIVRLPNDQVTKLLVTNC